MTWEIMKNCLLFAVWILFSCDLCCRLVRGLDCGYPGSPAFGRPHPVREVYKPGEAVSFTCAHGYSLQGPMQRVCTHNGTWAGPLPLCDRSLSSVNQVASSRQTLTSYPASQAVDGDPRTCTYTDKLRPRWVRIDMRTQQRVRAVALTVPSGIYSQDAAQLTIYAISVRDSTTASYHKCAAFNGKFSATTLKLSCAGGEVEGRYIHVEDNRNKVDYFSLCEIQVYVNKGSYDCGEAERPAHAYSVRTESGAVNYRCVYGYKLEGPSTRHCLQEGQWSMHQPICRATFHSIFFSRSKVRTFTSVLLGLDCGYPGSPAFGRPHPVREVYKPGEAVSFTCAHGYSLQGPMQRVCTHNGTWAGPLPLCDRSLSSVNQVASSRQTLTSYPASQAVDGDPRTCTYTDKLRPRWVRIDMRTQQRVRAVALTVPSGIYSQDAAQLTIYAISVRDSTTASYHKCAAFNGKFSATTLKLSCAGGEVEGRYIHVEDNRNKVDYFSLCEIQVYVNKGSYDCGEAERPAHAYSVRTESGAVNYRCVYGFKLEGPSTRHCLQEGQWSMHQPICREIICPHLGEVDHGRIHYVGRKRDQLTLGTMANVSCEYGYRTTGGPLQCEESGRWSRGNLSCQPVECGMPSVRHESEQYILLNGTRYGSVALLRCEDREALILCREDGMWSVPELDCSIYNNLSKLGLVEEEQNDVPTGIVIGMAVVVLFLLLVVILVLLLKRRKVLRRNSTESLPSKDTGSTLTPNSPQPYENDAFYATIPVDSTGEPIESKKNFMSTILFTRKKNTSDSESKKSPHDKKKDSEDSSGTTSSIYEEIGSKKNLCKEKKASDPSGQIQADPEDSQPVYAQVDLDEKRRSRLVKSLCERFDPVDPPPWEVTYRSEAAPSFDDVDLEPIKLRELPPIPDDSGSDITYASLCIPLEPPTLMRNNDIYEDTISVADTNGGQMKDNDIYLAKAAPKS
ncbi:sushi, von Willebrand factor type A, EGF and pentraxin domain-containing protein 1-like [Uloborus diversus]|uniref:sushi, von Willebrand factor type A, EGF and pentraxin domain-containing protein 1-like n=1 Tax=Uloborus diversus TaxID=327109 RepID=UPI002409CE7D|nr:sushi, von Willebrand factor type A, EGF and pentraxin domain-containing protein 1-like [Uloborus diversus]